MEENSIIGTLGINHDGEIKDEVLAEGLKDKLEACGNLQEIKEMLTVNDYIKVDEQTYQNRGKSKVIKVTIPVDEDVENYFITVVYESIQEDGLEVRDAIETYTVNDYYGVTLVKD